MKLRVAGLVIAAAALMAACAGLPSAPSVMALPGSGKTFEQFHTDDLACRQSAAQEIQSTKGGEVSAQRRYDMAYMQCMYAKGHQIPVPGGRPSYTSSSNAAAPATPAAAKVPAPQAGTPPPQAPAFSR